MRIETLYDEALKLSEPQRAELAAKLLESLDAAEQPAADPDQVKAAWDAEIARRVAAIKRGDVTLLDGDQVLIELQAELDSKR